MYYPGFLGLFRQAFCTPENYCDLHGDIYHEMSIHFMEIIIFLYFSSFHYIYNVLPE